MARGAPFDATPSARRDERHTTQVQNVVKILGLRFGTKYTAENIKTLRYGHLMIMTDQDHDGSCERRPYDRSSRGRSRDLKLPSPRRRGGAIDAPRRRRTARASSRCRRRDGPRRAPSTRHAAH